VTGRTHQIRVHLQASGCPVIGDPLYGPKPLATSAAQMALRAIALGYQDPFTKRTVRIEAPFEAFTRAFGCR